MLESVYWYGEFPIICLGLLERIFFLGSVKLYLFLKE
ncbi:hypothetical protein SAMN05192533_112119 [Mesobacillus persicus]|uniref:Uncharacterized protein n=1 Tax=Mesobacillus persicus TaxID=930146 RepID=A0A1H8G8I1_9BACI|nr:hypothetical protein SAMN05192533_112119 [Mesobacillus persicus]